MELAQAESIGERAEDYLRNPFERPDEHAAGERAMAGAADRASVVLDRLVTAGRTSLGRRVAVASACFHAIAGTGSPLLDRRRTPDRVFTALKLSRDAIADLAAAAARSHHGLRQLIGVSAAMHQVRAALWRTSFGESLYEALRLQPFLREQHVLLLGETGTGKELAARVIAGAVPGAEAPNPAINAAAIPRDLLESELFGHVKGAFTGAHGDRVGKIIAANGGTLFLDEVADLAPEVQPKLLRVVATGQVIPLGANEPRAVDVRYVCATSQPLVDQVEQGTFRRDLYERLAGLTIVIPPLRERPEDLRPIAEGLFARFARRMGLTEAGQADGTSTAQMPRMIATQARLLSWLDSDEARMHAWPGN
ncbi:MAG TPA: sigma 54-interacting transcriptional regulator, partial [Kofleriaceae bacterium]|nr:sigma 54-interacting transcriptional regulator [Kofleriaceae bacterium]